VSRTYRPPRSDAIWVARLSDLVAFLASHAGRCPSAASPDPIEHRLGDWVGHQRHSYRCCALSSERARQLEAVPNWSWEPRIDGWPRRLSDLAAFLELPGRRYPKRGSPDTTEHRLGEWVGNQKSAYKSGALSFGRARLLEALPGWTWSRRHTEHPVIAVTPARKASP